MRPRAAGPVRHVHVRAGPRWSASRRRWRWQWAWCGSCDRFLYFHPNADSGDGSDFSEALGSTYYPINTKEDRAKLLRYRDLAKAEPLVLFGGRLGTYKYLDMHMAIGSALSMFDNKLTPHFADGAALTSGGVDE